MQKTNREKILARRKTNREIRKLNTELNEVVEDLKDKLCTTIGEKEYDKLQQGNSGRKGD